jgi:flagellar biosynthesis/type III secretory pathway chaperone
MLHEALKRLLINLETSEKVQERLLDVARRKQQHLLSHDIEALRSDLKEEEEFAAEGEALHAERETLHRQCVRRLQAEETVRTLEELCKHMPGEWSGRFAGARERLRGTVKQLRHVNRLNMVLVNNSLELMQGLLAAVTNTEPAPTYGRRGGPPAHSLAVRTLDTEA